MATHELFNCSQSLSSYKCDLTSNEKCLLLGPYSESGAQEKCVKTCESCEVKSVSLLWMYSHQRKCHRRKLKKWFQCYKCSFASHTCDVLNCHILQEHALNIDKQTPHDWIDCGKSDKKLNDDLKLHMNSDAGDFKTFCYECDICSYRANSIDFLKKHKLLQHNMSNVDCLDDTAKSYNFVQDINKNDDETTIYICDQCDYETCLKYNLQQHKIVMHYKTPAWMQCEKCPGRKFENNEDFKQHLQKHLTGNKFKCSQCSFRTITKVALKKHYTENHSRKDYFQCNLCSFMAYSARSLQIHNKCHIVKHKICKEAKWVYKANNFKQWREHVEATHTKKKKFTVVRAYLKNSNQ